MKTILVDPSLCIQCCNCQISCKDEHCDNDWSPIAATQSEGQFWIQIREREVASAERMRLERVPVMCQQCADAPCMAAAEAAGVPEAVYRREDGIVIIDPKMARGVRDIMDACPYGCVYWNAELELPQKCTMCAHLLDAGWEKPRCVNACPVDALRYVDVEDLAEDKLYAPLERLNSEFGTHPTVAYVNLPKPFVAGAVYSPTEDKCLERVYVELENPVTGEVRVTETDYFGEFKIADISEGFWQITFDKQGYDKKTLYKLNVQGALNVGDVRLWKTPC